MFQFVQKGRRIKLAATGLVCLVIAVLFSGCQGVSFYRQAIAGEYEILAHRKSINDLLKDPKTPPKLKAKFEQVLKIRKFAVEELKEPGDDAYVKYTDLHRPYVVWNVNIAPALSLDPKTWWFPIVGRASYRGYFNEASARRYAAPWEKKGWDVYVDGVEAYSTLGWFSDPLLNTFIYEPEADLADVIFHELAHRRLFIEGDTDFNESYATAVASEGVRRWFAASNNPKDYEAYLRARNRDREFIHLIMGARNELQTVYTNASLTDPEKLKRKEEIIARLRADYTKKKVEWHDNGYDGWFAEPINNAKLNTISAYFEFTPAFTALIRAQNGDMEKFYAAVEALGKLPIEERHTKLRAYLKPAEADKSH
jgi:predicted aminopeptidase